MPPDRVGPTSLWSRGSCRALLGYAVRMTDTRDPQEPTDQATAQSEGDQYNPPHNVDLQGQQGDRPKPGTSDDPDERASEQPARGEQPAGDGGAKEGAE